MADERCATCGAFKTEVRGYSGEPDHFEYVCRNPKHAVRLTDAEGTD